MATASDRSHRYQFAATANELYAIDLEVNRTYVLDRGSGRSAWREIADVPNAPR